MQIENALKAWAWVQTVSHNTLRPLHGHHAYLWLSANSSSSAPQESWWREAQVLPSRTHPTMSTSGTGGYLLSGTKVAAAAPGAGGWTGPAGKRARR